MIINTKHPRREIGNRQGQRVYEQVLTQPHRAARHIYTHNPILRVVVVVVARGRENIFFAFILYIFAVSRALYEHTTRERKLY